MQITKEMIDLAISLKACSGGVKRAKRGFEFLTWEDKRWIAQQKETPISLLEKLSTDANDFVRSGVALNPSTPAAILERLSNDESWLVRRIIAYNPSTPVAILEKLSTDEIDFVRYYVERNPTWISYKK